MAENKSQVDEFYEAAMSAGARDNISPRARLEYSPEYYAADVFDPDGYSFEVVHKSQGVDSCTPPEDGGGHPDGAEEGALLKKFQNWLC